MLKKYLVIFYILVMVRVVHSDQLEWISLEQAEQTVEFINNENITQVILWCACCENTSRKLVNISKVYYKPVENYNFYEVHIEGNSVYGSVNETVDLAYVHIQKGIKWYCLGKELGFECDPCTKAFKF